MSLVDILTNIITGVVHWLTVPAAAHLPYPVSIPLCNQDFNPLVAKQRGEWYMLTVPGA